jgi:hypothetical protein
VIDSKISGKRGRGRQRKNILDGVCRWLGVTANRDIFRGVLVEILLPMLLGTR